MKPGSALFALMILVSVLISIGNPQSRSHKGAVFSEKGRFTLQVAAFPDELQAEEFAADLMRAGEKPVWGTVEIEGRGRWVRVFIGNFHSSTAARSYGKSLITRGLIGQFLVKSDAEIKALSRPRTTSRGGTQAIRVQPLLIKARELPVTGARVLLASEFIDSAGIPRPDPIRAAIRSVIQSSRPGGLWLSGDIVEGLERLKWIVGEENADLLSLDHDYRVVLDRLLLAKAAGVASANRPGISLVVSDYIKSNDGLLLVVQLALGSYRYLLHIGGRTETLAGEEIRVDGSINLDNNFDSRINPYRQGGAKLPRERPPAGFDALIAINPSARWFNLRTGKLVPVGNITFHELAEAHAKVEMKLEYLEKNGFQGAHDLAIEREILLKSQRPFQETVITKGSNRVFRSDEEVRRFKAERAGDGGQ
jgi:hypothetical protein